jgi:cholesterol transport system auxiliary component
MSKAVFIKNGRITTLIIIAVNLLLLPACSFFSPVKPEPTTSYMLTTLPQPVTKKATRRVTLFVSQPSTSQIYDTTQMVYQEKPFQLAYFAKNRWAAPPAQMLQLLLIQALQNTHYFYAVNAPSTAVKYDFLLNTQLLLLKQQFFTHSSRVFITLQAQIIKTANNQIIATKQFTLAVPAPENTPYGGVIAANQAVAKILTQIVSYCLDYMANVEK